MDDILVEEWINDVSRWEQPLHDKLKLGLIYLPRGSEDRIPDMTGLEGALRRDPYYAP